MRKKVFNCLCVLVVALMSTVRVPAREHDPLTTSYITPVRIMWTAGDVHNAHYLLEEFSGQVSVSSPRYATFSNRGGENAAVLLDFGKEYQGGIEIAAAIRRDAKPARVRVRYGESVSEAMSDGDTTATNDHAIRDYVVEVPWLGTIRVGESGFRFVRLDLLEDDYDLNLSAVRTVFRYRDIPYTGTFASDDARLDEIFRTGAYTVHLNMQNFLWDGIKRDRLVWVGDMHPEVMCINNVFGDNEVVRKSLDFARDDTPLPGWMNGMCSYSLWWIIIHKDYYLYQGDREYLLEQMPYMRELVSQVLDNIDGKSERFDGGTRFLDWPTSEMTEVIRAGLQAMAVMSLDAARQIAVWTADEKMERECAAAVARLRQYTPAHGDNKQAVSLLALAGLLDAPQAADILARGGASGFSTFYGYYMLEGLALAGRIDDALDIISSYWGGMLELGATTFWEDLTYEDLAKASRIDEFVPAGSYDIHADGGSYCYIGLRHSFCHGWASGPTSFLANNVLGIRPLEPGCAVVEIKPQLGRLDRAEGTFPTPHGVITVRHTKNADGSVHTVVEAPAGVKIIK